MAAELEADWLKFKNQARFIREVNANEIVIARRPKDDLIKELSKKNFLRIPPKSLKSEVHRLFSFHQQLSDY